MAVAKSPNLSTPAPLASRVRSSPVPVVISVAAPVMVIAPVLKVLSRVVAPCRVKAPGVVIEPMVLTLEAPEPKVLVSETPVAIVLAPDEVRVVKAPVEAVPEPIGPGAAKVAPLSELAFKLATLVVEATTNGAVPVARVEVSWPLRPIVVMPDKAPELMIRPLMVLVAVGPLKTPAEVMVPLPVVEILPEVEMVPSSVMVNLETPPDFISRAVLVAPLVSSNIKAGAVPCWVRVSDWSVAVSAKVKAMFRPSVVVMVLPEL